MIGIIYQCLVYIALFLTSAISSCFVILFSLKIFNSRSQTGNEHVQCTKRSEKIAIVGGGFAGIGSVSSLKEEGFDPICFEKSSDIGGTWCYREESRIGEPSIMPTTIINHSKEIGAVSNFPPRKEYNNYMRHWELYQYMKEYVDAKDVRRHIHTNTEVTSVRRTDNYDQTGQWSVTVRNTLTNEQTTDIYDRVIIAVGQYSHPKMPTYPGQDRFKGRVLHTHSLKGVESLKGKNVVVVGMGCSALDAAVESSSVAKQVYLSTRSGANVINRVGPFGYPIDYCLLRRFVTMHLDFLPTNVCAWVIRKFFLDPKFDTNLYAVKPNHHVFAKDPILNDHIGSRLLSGAVKQKKDILRFTENGVIFKGEEEKEYEVDVVIMGTGYEWKLPFLEKGVLVRDKDTGRINNYKCMWPTHLKHSTLCFIGFVVPFGPGFPIGELQCRLASHVFAGHKRLPSEKVMLADVKRRHDRNAARYTPDDHVTVKVDHVQYLDELARELGCKPNLAKLFFTDPLLWWKLVFGPCVSYQYRLVGPHKWPGARDAIMTVQDRLHYPLKGGV